MYKRQILDENGKMCADTTIRSKINAEQSAIAAMEEVCSKVGLKDSLRVGGTYVASAKVFHSYLYPFLQFNK